MSLKFKSATLTPSTVYTWAQFIISVEIEITVRAILGTDKLGTMVLGKG